MQELERRRKPGGQGAIQRPDPASGTLATYGDKSLAEIKQGDVLSVNWEAVKRQLNDLIVRIEHEGGLDAPHIAEAIQVVIIALQDLAGDEEIVRNRLAALPEVGFFHYVLALLPTTAGGEVRKIILQRFSAERRGKRFKELATEVQDLRIAVAEAIDGRIHRQLLSEDPEYRQWSEQHDQMADVVMRAHEIILQIDQNVRDQASIRVDDTGMRAERMRRAEALKESWITFYCEQKCTPALKIAYDHIGRLNIRPQHFLGGLQALKQKLEIPRDTLEQQMRHRRDEVKQTIYTQARAETE